MDKILLASNNSNKIREIGELLKPFRVEVKSLRDMGLGDPLEDGKTFAENALIKARYGFDNTGLPTLADDSGFCIDGLNDFPGLCSARFAKAAGGYGDAFRILNECTECIDKKAHYITVLAFAYGDKNKRQEDLFEGRIDGMFTFPVRGDNGFGYDPSFIPDGYTETFGELPNDVRIKMNHRAVALNKFIEFFKNL